MDQREKAFYLRDERGNRVALVVSEITDDKYGHILRFASASYNPKDKFNTQVAWDVARGRLRFIQPDPAKQSALLHHYHGGAINLIGIEKPEIKPNIVKLLAEHAAIPSRTRKAAQLWLSKKTETKAA